MDRLYLDMDGVLMDFNASLRAHGVVDNETHFIHKPRIEWTPSQVDLDLRVRKVMELPTFWPSIPIMPDALSLWSFCQQFSPRILTATPNITEHRDRIAQQKRESIWQHFDPQFPATNIIVCLRAEKKALARPGAVLVDDMPSNCAEWEAHGGTAILHKNAADTIKKLAELFLPRMVGADRNAKPALRQRNSAERKAEPLHTGVMLYFPDALAAIARLSKAGNDKHNPGQPLHWSRGKSADHSDCVARHSLTPLLVDPETGEIEAVAKAWRTLAELQLLEEKRLTAAGIMPYSGVTP